MLATQAILLSLRSTNLLRSKSALGATQSKQRFRFDYMGASKWFFSASGTILLIGALAIAGKGLKFGIDFESGTRIQASLSQSASVDSVPQDRREAGYDAIEVQSVKDPDIGKNVVQIKGKIKPSDVSNVTDVLRNKYGLVSSSDQTVGPTFGKSIANSAVVAIIASLLVISMYIALRFQWKFAVPVLIALMHDILITAGVYALVGREVTASTVAALLTILGFSLYDTIIVFDRVRENIPRMPSATFSQIVNRSMSEVIVRSLATSFCTLLPVLALLLFGGDTLKDFAFALLVGVASGAYSSVFIASPVLTHWKEREPIYRARIARVLSEQSAVPAYAVTAEGQNVDVVPKTRRRRSSASPEEASRRRSSTTSSRTWASESKPAIAPPRSTQRPAGGRRAAAKDGEDKDRKPRNTRHGRPR